MERFGEYLPYSGANCFTEINGRNGDVVEVRVSEDGKSLNIKDNHPVDPELGASNSASLVTSDE